MLLQVDALETYYDASQVLFGVSLAIDRAQVVTLLGRNGMGKTTTIHSLMGIVPSRSGSIVYEGREIRGLPSYRIARFGIGFVPEGRQIFPKLTVRENLVATARPAVAGNSAWTYEAVCQLFPRLAERAEQSGSTLSGGEQQMLAIGRALMTNPTLLILDEATEGLAPLIREEIWRCLHLLKQAGQSILIVDKNIAALSLLADRHHVMEKGRIVWSGTPAALDKETDVINQYLSV